MIPNFEDAYDYADLDEPCDLCGDSGEVECGECEGSCVDLEGEDCIVCGGEGVTACPDCG